MTDREPRILFLGTHGQYNIGDELLLETFLHQLGDAPSYVVNTYDKAFTARQLCGRYSVELIDTARDRLALVGHLRRADAVVFGGGSIVKELYASVGRNRYATLLMILAIVTFARWIARTPVAMLNIGVGPLPSRTGRFLAGLVLRQADLVTVRDPGSTDLCAELGVRGVVASTDAVFSVGAERLLAGPRPELAAGERPLRIALNLNFDIENPEAWEPFLTALATALQGLAADRPLELHGLPMQSRGKHRDDAQVLREFAARLPGVTFVEHRPETPADVARLVAAADLLVSERLHAIVMASILGVPAFVLAYDVKVRELAGQLGLHEECVDINAPLEAGDLEARLATVLDDRDGAAHRLQARSGELAGRARAGFDASRAWLAEVGR